MLKIKWLTLLDARDILVNSRLSFCPHYFTMRRQALNRNNCNYLGISAVKLCVCPVS